MNARSQVVELLMDNRQAPEGLTGFFHTVFLHRTVGKFTYTSEATYSVSSLGIADVDCENIDLTYVSCSSDALDQFIKQEVNMFCQQLFGNSNTTKDPTAQISLEFYQKKPNRIPYLVDCTPWEVWTIRLTLVTDKVSEYERQQNNFAVGEALQEKMLYITEVINKHEYTPKLPNQSELTNVFDTSFPDVQPYLFKFKYQKMPSVGNTMKKLIRDTLSL